MNLTGLSFAYPDLRASERATLLRPNLPVDVGETDVFFLSTCLRVEIVWSGSPDLAPTILEGLYGAESPSSGKMRTDLDAFHHVSRVAAGLESVEVGEKEVLSQFRRAVEHFVGDATGGNGLARVMKAALGVGRTARRSLQRDQGESLALTAARMVESLPDVVVIGGGAMARAVVRRLGASNVTVYSRTPKPVAGVRSRPWEELADGLATTRAVVSTIPGPVPALADVERSGDDRLLVVDLGMPPAIDDAEVTPHLIYRSVDDVAASVPSMSEPVAEEAVALESVKAWRRFSVSDQAGTIISSVVEQANRTVDEEVRRLSGRIESAPDPDQILRQLAHNVARRIIHPSVALLGSTPLTSEELEIVARALGVDRD